jgi:hypothetical protein
MFRSYRSALALVVPFVMLFVAAGCESVALFPRPDISRTDPDVRDLPPPVENIAGTVERIDESRRQIQLRTPGGQIRVVKYDPNTVVFNRDERLTVASLRSGDTVFVQVTGSPRGEQYVEVIRMDQRLDARRSY